MDCKEIIELLPALVDDELGPREALQVRSEEHTSELQSR